MVVKLMTRLGILWRMTAFVGKPGMNVGHNGVGSTLSSVV